ncbi:MULTISPECIES: hypothetical protein [Salinicoccus]|uniref:hypothetical protein n=1 Tax=Salinicoccus TaxID=45669 RepID=UPI0015CCBF43|nr:MULTISPECIES: hypothetical protein [Salinicoccus]
MAIKIKKLKNIRALRNINNVLFDRTPKTTPIGETMKVKSQKGLEISNKILGIQTRMPINKQIKEIVVNLFLILHISPHNYIII